MMDQNSPIFLTENSEKSLLDSQELIEKWHKRNNLLFYALTPRFAITCSFDLMKKISMLAQNYDCYIQTHLAENKQEVKTVKKLFPKFKDYLDVYDKAEIIGKKTLIAHCIYLNDEDLNLIKKTETKTLHCPT